MIADGVYSTVEIERVQATLSSITDAIDALVAEFEDPESPRDIQARFEGGRLVAILFEEGAPPSPVEATIPSPAAAPICMYNACLSPATHGPQTLPVACVRHAPEGWKAVVA